MTIPWQTYMYSYKLLGGDDGVLYSTKYDNIYVDLFGNVYKGLYWNGPFLNVHMYSPYIDNVGYYQVVITVDGKRKHLRVHRLVAESIVDNPNHLPMVNHIDGNKLNNTIHNLEFTNNSYNVKHAYDNGLYRSKTRCPIRAKDKCNGEVFEFDSIRECSRKLNVNRKSLSSILTGAKSTNNYNYTFEYI